MIRILELIDCPDKYDKSFITEGSAENYLSQLSEGRPVELIMQRFKNFNKELLRILANLLEINPYYRKPVSELIKSPIFDKIRVPSLEKPAEGIINLDIDRMNAFDYDNHHDFVMADINAYRKAILKEIKKIKQDRGSTNRNEKPVKSRPEK